ncbi:MAG: hypothetical protein LBL05_05510, partial [Synergistaceae bacterium]|nr:hypothetical protein [Synergistaceae bacterium]
GILHAPGSLVTYEPQRVSDTSAFFQTMVSGYGVGKELLTKFYPDDKKNDMRYIVDSLDWEANIDPDFKANHYHEPIEAAPRAETLKEGYAENWIVYGSLDFSAKELTVQPGRTVVIKDNAAYGLIMMDGYGSINGSPVETPAVIRYGGKTSDEKYVAAEAAGRGVTITNASADIPLVMLKHFGPENPDAAKFVKN